MSSRSRPAVIVISSHVARGSVGNRAAVFALETLGFPVWAVPTIQLPWHPGHGPSTRIVAEETDFSGFLKNLAEAPWREEVGAILTGYMANAAQTRAVARLVSAFKKERPETVYLCDPVIGDTGGLYVAEETASGIRDNLLPLCDIATPNFHEMCWIAGSEEPDNLPAVLNMIADLDLPQTLVTSVPCLGTSETGNLLQTREGILCAGHTQLAKPPNGPGDLTAALFLGHHLAGIGNRENLSLTTASVLEILEHSASRGSDELTLEADWESIVRPATPLEVMEISEQT